MNEEKRLIARDKCTACEACKDVCQNQAISMEKDTDGFYFPVINEKICVHCHMCEKVCPVDKENQFRHIDYNDDVAYGGYNTNKKELSSSTSGGFFSVLSHYVLKQNGLVFGVVYKDNFRRIIYSSTDEDSIESMQGSKYLTAEKNGVYLRAKEELKKGRLVLFVGLPCEIAALYSVLGKDYEKLITCELICAGPASYNVHNAQLDWLERKYGLTTYFTYRSKKYGWVPLCLKAKNGNHTYDVLYDKTLFGIGFPYAKRTACFNCYFKDTKRLADFTIGDFWRVDRGSEYYNEGGCSVIFTRTKKANTIMNSLNGFFSVKVEKDVAQRGNYTQLKKHSAIPAKRAEYLETLRLNGGVDLSVYDKFRPSERNLSKIKKLLPVPIYRFLRKFDKGNY